MKVIRSFPRPVREIENCWIPLADGQRLAARIWLPKDALSHPVPAIMEYLPYRKRDGTRWRDEPMHHYFAGHGYASVRVDLRGSGDSDGLLHDEYLPQEQQDGVEAIAWLAAQPWCSGRVGMMGKSWGGFNALQIAAHRPPALSAILTVCSTDDRYADDAHFMGGCLLNENLSWGAFFFSIAAMPPDPALVGESWREMWKKRLESLRPFPTIWLQHQHRDAYWKQGSVCEDYQRIRCPVYAVGGWADAYTNAIPRLLAGLQVPRKGLIGPWGHLYPHNGKPGPAIGFLQEALRWWDYWLKDIETGILSEPMYRVWMQDGTGDGHGPEQLGRWLALSDWPRAESRGKHYLLGAGILQSVEADGWPDSYEPPIVIQSPPTIGHNGGSWCSFGEQGELPGDQREDDSGSAVFDTVPLVEPLQILGAVQVRLSLAVDQPWGFICVRLNDVAPDGNSTRITYGLLNLAHRGGHTEPQPLEPGQPYTVTLTLNDVAYRVGREHCLRLAVSTSYWPMVWPAPRPVTLTLFPNECRLTVPQSEASSADPPLRPFAEPECGPPLNAVDLHPDRFRRTIHRDLSTGETTYTTHLNVTDDGTPTLAHISAIDLTVGHGIIENFTIGRQDPLSARAELQHGAVMQRGDWSVRVTSRLEFHATAGQFHLQAALRAEESGVTVFERQWEEAVDRDGV